jgi:hypothetical protein
MVSPVFVSYNPNSDVEQTLAVRLHTIGSVHGFNMILPDRTANDKIMSAETKSRILQADYFILFSTTQLSRVVYEEISLAYAHLQSKARILVIYDQSVGISKTYQDKFTCVGINRSSRIESIVEKIIEEIKKVQVKRNAENGFLSVLGGLLLTGIALFTLSALDSPEIPNRQKKPKVVRRKPLKESKKSLKRVAV